MSKRNKKKNKDKKNKEKKNTEIETANIEIKDNSNVNINNISSNKNKKDKINKSKKENNKIEKNIDNNITDEELNLIIMKFISIDDNIDEKDYEKVEDNSKIAKPSDSTKIKNYYKNVS